ncbi:phage tail fiber protein [Streptomyces massasporeus]|uniref:phage tail fiber protein n=1 Tax=Streptomyces massasporeus TaxID=67324 RepID=UPI00167BA779|nr:hypothetical protein [Streptomyces massasporeus]GGV91639.1 hypothetical protein GCM10010228_82520 [Streptomyces massasporeus]
MANLTLTASNQALAWLFGLSATGPSGDLQAALVTAAGTASAAGTEVTGGSYARQDLTVAAPTGGATSNAAEIVFAGMPACTVVGVEVWDSAGTPVRFWFGALDTPRTVLAGDDVRFAAGELDFSLS